MNKKKTVNEWASGGKIRCHTLKSWPIHFQAVLAKKKTAELRRMDREFHPGDFVLLSEYVPEGEPMSFGAGTVRLSSGEFTGAWIKIKITHVEESAQFLKPGYGLLSFQYLEDGQLEMKDLRQLDLLGGQV